MPASTISTTRLQRITAMLQKYLDEKKLSGMTALVSHRGQIVYESCLGLMDIEAAKPMQPDAIFRIASMSKPVTSIAAMMLYEEGAFHLNTPVSKFIPGFGEAGVFVSATGDGLKLEKLKGPLTMRHLFTHTAGLSYGWDANDPVDRLYQQTPELSPQRDPTVTLGEAMQALARLPLKFQPGTRWQYSLSIAVIGYIVELISGQTLDRFLEERLFKPLGMPDTAFYVPAEKMQRVPVVYGHLDGKDGLQRMRDQDLFLQPLPHLPVYLIPDGGLFSTLHDYGRFAQMLVNGGELDGARLLSPTTVAMMEINQTPAEALPYGFTENDLYHAGYGYSLGMRVLMEVAATGQAGSVGEFGWDGAFSTYFWIDRHEQLFGVLMLQHHPNAYFPIANQFKALTYQALDNG